MALDNKGRRHRDLFAVLWSAVFLFRLWFISSVPLSGDEVYHWEWSRHLAFGYYDHPGLTAYLIRLSTWLLGGSTEFSVRLPALLMLSGASLVGFALARDITLHSGAARQVADKAGLLAGSLLLIAPIYAVFGVYISTDPPVICFWVLSLYAFYRALWGGGWWSWIGAGAAFGLAMLSKFLAFPLVPAMAAFVLMSKEHRRWLASPRPYVAGLVALAVFSPLLWWNATHEWATFMFNFVYRQESRSLAPQYAVEFVLAQAVALSPGIWAFAMAGLVWAFRDWRSGRNAASLYLGLSCALPFAYFFYTSLQRRIGLHWPAPVWTGMLVYLAVRWAPLADLPERAREWKWARRAIGLAAVILVAASAVIHLPPSVFTREWRYRGAPVRINSRMHSERFGWRELGERVDEVTRKMAAAQKGAPRGVFLITGQYGLSSAVSFYAPGQPYAHLWAPRRTHGENYRFWDRFEELKDQDAIYVSKKEDNVREALPKLREHFKSVEEPERLPVLVNGREVRAFFLIRCRGFNGVAPAWPERATPGTKPRP
jgi:hypothetical protein